MARCNLTVVERHGVRVRPIGFVTCSLCGVLCWDPAAVYILYFLGTPFPTHKVPVGNKYVFGGWITTYLWKNVILIFIQRIFWRISMLLPSTEKRFLFPVKCMVTEPESGNGMKMHRGGDSWRLCARAPAHTQVGEREVVFYHHRFYFFNSACIHYMYSVPLEPHVVTYDS